MKPILALIAVSVLSTGCVTTDLIDHKPTIDRFVSAKSAEDLARCVYVNADKTGALAQLSPKMMQDDKDGQPRVSIRRGIVMFAVVDAKPKGSGSEATVYHGLSGAMPETSMNMLREGCQ